MEIEDGDQLDLAAPRSLFNVVGPDLPLLSGSFVNVGATYRVSADGDRFLRVYLALPSPFTEIVVIQHWFGELTRLVPID